MNSQNALMAQINLDIHKALKTGGHVRLVMTSTPVLVIHSMWAWRGWHSEVTYSPASSGVSRQDTVYDDRGMVNDAEGGPISAAWPFAAC